MSLHLVLLSHTFIHVLTHTLTHMWNTQMDSVIHGFHFQNWTPLSIRCWMDDFTIEPLQDGEGFDTACFIGQWEMAEGVEDKWEYGRERGDSSWKHILIALMCAGIMYSQYHVCVFLFRTKCIVYAVFLCWVAADTQGARYMFTDAAGYGLSVLIC